MPSRDHTNLWLVLQTSESLINNLHFLWQDNMFVVFVVAIMYCFLLCVGQLLCVRCVLTLSSAPTLIWYATTAPGQRTITCSFRTSSAMVSVENLFQ